MTIRVAHLVSGLFYGGGQRVVFDLLRSEHAGLEQQLWLLGDQGKTRLNGLSSEVIPYDGIYNRWMTLHTASSRLRALLKKHRVDILQSHGLDADLIGSLAAGGVSTLHIAHLHSMPNLHLRSWNGLLRNYLYRSLTWRANTKFVAVADAVRRENANYYGLHKRSMHVIRNGVDTREFCRPPRRRDPHRPVVFGFAGRLVKIKGLDYLLQAVIQVQNMGLDFRLFIAGQGNQETMLKQKVMDNGLGERVKFLGHIDDVSTFYDQIDVLVLPSLSEGLPLVVLEAMANHLPVIATDVGGTGEVISDMQDGWLVPAKDSKSFGRAMSEIILDPRLLRFGDVGAEKVMTEYSLLRVHEAFGRFYGSLVRRENCP